MTEETIKYRDAFPKEYDSKSIKQEQGEPVLWAAKESMFMWGNSDESGHPYHIICKGKKVKSHQIPLYTTPQPAQKPWVGLTDEEYLEAESVVWVTINLDSDEKEANREFYKAIEAKLKEKNGT